jgi:hypothetical protein
MIDEEKYKIAEEYLSRNNQNSVFVITWQIKKYICEINKRGAGTCKNFV